jgi:hypothetical protein
MLRQWMLLLAIGLIWVSGIGLAMGLSTLDLPEQELFGESSFSEQDESQGRIRAVIQFLSLSVSGRALLARAETLWGRKENPGGGLSDLARVLRWGDSSKTDAVIIRHFDPKTGKERRERKVTIILKKELKLDDLVIDLAHEMVHATSRTSLDPYDPELTSSSYIRNAIEGEGGEVDAVLQECQVSFELAAQSERFKSNAKRCSAYLKPETNSLDRILVVRDFYRVGEWSDELKTSLGEEFLDFPWLSSEKPRLYSSTGHAPYPVALLREFEGVTEIACENARKRLDRSPGQLAARHKDFQGGSHFESYVDSYVARLTDSLNGILFGVFEQQTPVRDPASLRFIQRRCMAE